MACCSHRPIAGTRVDDRFAGGAGVGRRGRPLPVPEDGLPSLKLTFGRRRVCSVPSVRRCHVGLLPLLPELVLGRGEWSCQPMRAFPRLMMVLESAVWSNRLVDPLPPLPQGSARYLYVRV